MSRSLRSIMHVRQRGATIAVAAALLAAFARPTAAQSKVDRQGRMSSNPSVRLEGSIQSIRVTGWKLDSLSLTGVLPAGVSMTGGISGEPADPALRAKMIFQGATGAKFALDGSAGEKGAILELRVPFNSRVWIKAVDATVVVAGVSGGIDINVVGGSVQVTGPAREVSVESMDAKVTIDGSASWLRVKTATGDVSMTGGSGDAAFNTVSGTVRVANGQFERAKFESISGQILFAAEPSRGASLDFYTHNGQIEFRPSGKINTDIDVTAINGTITNTLTNHQPVVAGRGQTLHLTVGFTDGAVSIRTFKGSVLLGVSK